MALNIPKNKIQEGKYTSGGEYIVESTNTVYTGYYYILNNEAFAGKEYNSKAPKLVLVKDRNKLLNRGKSLATFSLISGITSQILQTPKITSLPETDLENSPQKINNNTATKYYCRNTTQKDIIIKEIDEATYKTLKQNPIYQTTSVTFIASPGFARGIPQNLDQAEKELPGIKIFLGL
jgi:hypothetical protein